MGAAITPIDWTGGPALLLGARCGPALLAWRAKPAPPGAERRSLAHRRFLRRLGAILVGARLTAGRACRRTLLGPYDPAHPADRGGDALVGAGPALDADVARSAGRCAATGDALDRSRPPLGAGAAGSRVRGRGVRLLAALQCELLRLAPAGSLRRGPSLPASPCSRALHLLRDRAALLDPGDRFASVALPAQRAREDRLPRFDARRRLGAGDRVGPGDVTRCTPPIRRRRVGRGRSRRSPTSSSPQG